MGTSGPAPKDPRRRQRRADPKGADIVPIGQRWIETPQPRPGWLKATKDEWAMLWGDTLHAAFVFTDVPELLRLYDLKDERERIVRAIRKGIVVEGPDGKPQRVSAILVPGSTTNVVLNPLFKLRSKLDDEILALSDRFALNLKARMAMNVDLGKLAKALGQLNEGFEEDDDDERDDGADPRAALVQLPDPHGRREDAS